MTRGGLLDIKLTITDPLENVLYDKLAFFNRQVQLERGDTASLLDVHSSAFVNPFDFVLGVFTRADVALFLCLMLLAFAFVLSAFLLFGPSFCGILLVVIRGLLSFRDCIQPSRLG